MFFHNNEVVCFLSKINLCLVSARSRCCYAPPAKMTYQIQVICAQVEEASKLEHDCAQMADKLEPALHKLNDKLDNISPSTKSQEFQKAYIESLSVCTSTLFIIRTGSCRNDPDVHKALEILEIRM